MHRYLWLGLGVCLLTGGAQAEMITLGTDAPSGSPLEVVAGGAVSGPLLVTVANNVDTDDPADFMAGWQVTLMIMPDAAATGQVGFNSAVEPSNYVFGTRGAFYSQNLSFPVNNDGMFALDANLDGSLNPAPVVVPVSGRNLNELGFVASADASGIFGVFVVPGVGNTEWTDAGLNVRSFENVPSGGDPVRIGEINVVPEPASLTILAFAAAGLVYRRPRH